MVVVCSAASRIFGAGDRYAPSRAASQAAAGIINPVTGRRIVKSWLADTVLPFATRTYTQLEKELQISFFQPLPFLCLYEKTEEKNDFLIKSGDAAYRAYLQEWKEPLPVGVRAGNFAGKIMQSACVHPSILLPAYRRFLQQKGYLTEDIVNKEEIEIGKNDIRWKGCRARALIFCDGHWGAENPFFPDLPFLLSKGEALLLRNEAFSAACFVKKGATLCPQPQRHTFWIGSTYSWNDLERGTCSETARAELLAKAAAMIDTPFEIYQAVSGIRPTVRHRRPLIGRSDWCDKVYIFNGFGTKAFMLAPYFAAHFTAYLQGKNPLDAAIDIACISQNFGKP
ncbi:MAG: FAD-binding oxidoreductase [Sphingobacteriales bacterium]|nr:FAD-binding oxidoreductase [Sphingobacteriales bacterium]